MINGLSGFILPLMNHLVHERIHRFCPPVTLEVPAADHDLSAFARRFGWNWPIVVDGDYEFSRQFHVVGTPTTVVVDSRGRVATVLLGAISASELTATLSRLVA